MLELLYDILYETSLLGFYINVFKGGNNIMKEIVIIKMICLH